MTHGCYPPRLAFEDEVPRNRARSGFSMLNTSDTRKEFAGLEMARFLCALAVMIYHYQFFSIIAIPTNHGWAGYNWAADNVDKLPLYWLLWWLYHNGLYAVQIFWMISGFIFFWKYSHPDQSADGLGLSVFCPTIFSTLPPAFCDADCSRTAAVDLYQYTWDIVCLS